MKIDALAHIYMTDQSPGLQIPKKKSANKKLVLYSP